jgi:hypothetical protein
VTSFHGEDRNLNDTLGASLLRWFLYGPQTSSTYPAVDEINALPEKVRRYIHDLETRISTEGNALNILELANERDALRWRVEELEAQLQLHRRVEQLEAQVAPLTTRAGSQ